MSATRFKTESGTVYEINHEGTYVRRTTEEPDGRLRGDGDWIALLLPVSDVQVGQSVKLVLEPQHPSADCTLRLTSPVTVIL